MTKKSGTPGDGKEKTPRKRTKAAGGAGRSPRKRAAEGSGGTPRPGASRGSVDAATGNEPGASTGDLLAALPPRPSRVPADQAARDQIRTRLDETIVVEAAAGTGKTTMLVERIVALLSSGRGEVDRIVAVTFTEKAAGELKLRIRERLESARQDAPAESAEKLNLERALARLEEAWVGTIHGFCADLLRERSVAANVDPDYRTLTEPEAIKLFRETFDLWLQQTLESPPEGVRRSLRRTASGQREDGPVGRLHRAAWSLAEWRDFPHAWRRDPFPREARIDEIVAVLHSFAERSEQCAKKANDNLYLDTEKYRRLSRELAEAEPVRGRDYDGLEGTLIELLRGWAPRKGYGKEYGAGITREEIHAELTDLIDRIREFECDADADLAALLQGELQQVIESYEERKAKLGLLDFVDLLVRARDLIRGDSEVRAEFQTRFTHVFVDEFQDTDPIQAEILMLLASDDPEVWNWQFVRPQPGKLFVVGDPKQSIYRFRRADVSIYSQVKSILERSGATCLQLTTNFRTVENLQRAVNTAFAPWMRGDTGTLQADYVPLTPWRQDREGRPSLIALPVPQPFGARGVTKTAIDGSLPGAVASFVNWMLTESGWTVKETVRVPLDASAEGEDEAKRGGGSPSRKARDGARGGADANVGATTGANAETAEARRTVQMERERPLQPRDVCLLFRRFDNFFLGDITRGYVRALEAHGIRHLLVGGRSFHEREEVETVRTALNAIEWPDDELSVFATLRGAFFAIGDEELFEFRQGGRKLHPFRKRDGDELPEHLRPIDDALQVLGQLHRARNQRPIADTVSTLLDATRAHATFVLRPSGDQVLANVLHVAEQARSYESSGGISFRGFVEELLADADRRTAPEAPILEEGSDGVRIMTVHRAKGLEFPVVILCDMTANLSGAKASRYLDSDRRLCVSRLAGWSPVELLENEDSELGRDRAEGIRVAYVAATRARDLLVVPAIGSTRYGEPKDDALTGSTWLFPLNGALYDEQSNWSLSTPALGCPTFGPFSVIGKGEGVQFDFETVRPGFRRVGSEDSRHDVVWWDATLLAREEEPRFGVRRDDLMKRDVDPEVVGRDLTRFQDWEQERQRTLQDASHPGLRLSTVTERARLLAEEKKKLDVQVETIELEIDPSRPGGARFGALVHAMLATVPMDGGEVEIERAAALQGRLLGATDRETVAAEKVVSSVLRHPLLGAAFEASGRDGECLREVPVTSREADGTILDGVIDLAFRQGETWVVVDFKTDQELEESLQVYKRQVGLYATMLSRATKRPARGVILRV
ncbi:MAG: UvrD-helicase domain-containing protein [Candidatus Eisenbacteria bacterium]